MSELPETELWCDGACSGNPGPGGWAALLRRRVTLPRPPQGCPDVVGHYAKAIEAFERRGLRVGGGRWRDALASNQQALQADSSQPVRVMVERVISDGEAQTTNNRMELSGLLFGLRALDRAAAVQVHTDSAYLMDAFTKGWLAGWQRKGWVKSDGKPVANRDLWEELLVEHSRHQVTFVKVKGHAGVELNELVDRLAVAARDRAAGR